jgi:hypothetical protein
VTALAAGVRRDTRRAEHVDAGMAGFARSRVRFRELVRTMAPDAFRVSAGKERRRRNDRRVSRMTLLAFRRRRGCRSVQMNVARGADGACRLVLRRVARVHARVTVDAGPAAGQAVLVRCVTTGARAFPVDLDLRRFVAFGYVTPVAGVGRDRRVDVRDEARASEFVTRRAVRRSARPELLNRVRMRVLERTFLLVTSGATRRLHRTHRVTLDVVALSAGDELFDDVNAVPCHLPVRLPLEGDVHPFARGAPSGIRRLGPRARGDHAEQHRHDEPKWRWFTLRRRHGAA